MTLLARVVDWINVSWSDRFGQHAVVDRRSAPRYIYMSQGWLSFLERPAYPPVDCLIRDVSAQGAQIEIRQEFDETLLEGAFRLYVSRRKLEYPCEVIWRHEEFMGLKFCGEPLKATRDYTHPLQRGGLGPTVDAPDVDVPAEE